MRLASYVPLTDWQSAAVSSVPRIMRESPCNHWLQNDNLVLNFCNFSIFSIPLFSRTSISSLESILTDSTNARIRYSSHSVMAVPACSRVSAASSMRLVSSASSACCRSSSARLAFSSACWERIVLNRSL